MATKKTRQQKAKVRQRRKDKPAESHIHVDDASVFIDSLRNFIPRIHLSNVQFPKIMSVPVGQKAILFNEQTLSDVDKILKARSSSVEKYLEAQLIKFLNIKLVHGLDDDLTFGQYSGMNVREICQTDLDYMHWLVIEQSSKKFDGKVREYVQFLASQDLRRSR